MAAHIENKEVTVLDQIGLAQKEEQLFLLKYKKNNKIFSSLINEALATCYLVQTSCFC